MYSSALAAQVVHSESLLTMIVNSGYMSYSWNQYGYSFMTSKNVKISMCVPSSCLCKNSIEKTFTTLPVSGLL